MIRVKTSSIRHIIQHITARQAVPGEISEEKINLKVTISSLGIIYQVCLKAGTEIHIPGRVLRDKNRQQKNATQRSDEKQTE